MYVHKYDNVYLLMLYKTEYEFEIYCSAGECIMSLVSVQDSTMSWKCTTNALYFVMFFILVIIPYIQNTETFDYVSLCILISYKCIHVSLHVYTYGLIS